MTETVSLSTDHLPPRLSTDRHAYPTDLSRAKSRSVDAWRQMRLSPDLRFPWACRRRVSRSSCRCRSSLSAGLCTRSPSSRRACRCSGTMSREPWRLRGIIKQHDIMARLTRSEKSCDSRGSGGYLRSNPQGSCHPPTPPSRFIVLGSLDNSPCCSRTVRRGDTHTCLNPRVFFSFRRERALLSKVRLTLHPAQRYSHTQTKRHGRVRMRAATSLQS